MDEYVQDNSGISSLGGFSYQIRVFVYYMLSLKDNMQIEFETIDDVNIKKIGANEIDVNDEKFLSKVGYKGDNTAIQVKRTSIAESVAKKVLLNWMLLESSEINVNKYILFTDKHYNNKDLLFNKSAKELFKCVNESTNNARAIITKVKNKYKNNFEAFEKTYNLIKNKYKFISVENIDKKIDDSSATLFRKSGVNEVVYYNRIKELLQHITVEIIEAVNNKNSYVFSYNNFMSLIEEISLRITENVMLPLYVDFKKTHKINFKDLEIFNSREYRQLVECGLPQVLIEQHLVFCGYYENLRFLYLETGKLSKISSIEETTYENFLNVKFRLQKIKQDEPYNRLEETKKESNSYADCEQIKFGSNIYLTKDSFENGNNQISWKDE